jgi:hypothetical protein
MRPSHRLPVFVLSTLMLAAGAGCSKADSRAASSAAAPAAEAPGGGGAMGGERASADVPAADRALILTVDTSVRVTSVDDASAKVRAAVEKAGGYVSDASVHGDGEARSARLELRVPARGVSSLRTTLAGLGEITSDSEKVEDVTDARADLKARLANARVQEKRILTIMSERAGSIAEVIAAEHELARVRETIERLEAQERTMDGKIAMATVRVSLTGPAAAAAWETPGPSLARAAKNGGRGAAAIAVYGAMAFATVAPTIVPIVGFGLVLYYVLRRRRHAALPQSAA